MADRTGQQLGNYRLLRLLGQGGFAEVYLGEHVRLKTQVAVKILHTYLSEKETANFQNEAETISKLIHPHIVRLLDFHVQDGQPFYVIDYAPNGSLRQPPGTSLPLAQVVTYVKQVASALQYAHDQRFVHRDVKPANMLLGIHNTVLLGDFGIVVTAHSTSSMSQQNAQGTLIYMAPEQIQGKPRPASDQYALAVSVYHWLCGVPPFQGTASDIIVGHLQQTPRSLREQIPSLTAEVEQVILTAMNKEPHQRFSSVSAFADALERASLGMQEHLQDPPRSIRSNTATPAEPTAQASLQTRLQSTQIMPGSQSGQPISPLANNPSPHDAFPSPTPPEQHNPPREKSRHTRRSLLIAGGTVAGLATIGSIFYIVKSGNSKLNTPSRQDPVIHIYTGHQIKGQPGSPIYNLSWSPDSKRIISLGSSPTGKDDLTAQVWNASDGSHTTTYHLPEPLAGIGGIPESAIHAVDIHWRDDNPLLVSAGQSGLVTIVDLNSGTQILTYRGHIDRNEDISDLHWSPDGRYIASIGRSYEPIITPILRVWNAATGQDIVACDLTPEQAIQNPKTADLTNLRWSPDSRRLLSWGIIGVSTVWDALSGKRISRYLAPAAPLLADAFTNNAMTFDVQWASDGQHLISYYATSPQFGPAVYLWNANTGRQPWSKPDLFTVTHSGQAWSPDNQFIAFDEYKDNSNSQDVTIRKASDGSLVSHFSPTPGGFAPYCWSPDGKYIAALGRTLEDHSFFLGIWEAATGHLSKKYSSPQIDSPGWLNWSPDGKLIATLPTGGISIWQIA